MGGIYFHWVSGGSLDGCYGYGGEGSLELIDNMSDTRS